jgi:hypothetical protein
MIAGIKEIHFIVSGFFKPFDDHSRNLSHLLKGDLLGDLEECVIDRKGLSPVGVISLPADQDEANGLVGMLFDKVPGIIEDIGIVPSAESFVRSDEDQTDAPDLSLDQQGMANGRQGGRKRFHNPEFSAKGLAERSRSSAFLRRDTAIICTPG